MRAFVIAVTLVIGVGARAEEGQRLVSVELTGKLVEKKDKLLRFLGLTPGAVFDDTAQKRLGDDLKRLNYRVVEQRIEPAPDGVKLKLEIAPVRVVRHVVIKKNWPLFEDEVLRHLRLRSGMPLVPDEELRAVLDEEEQHVATFLQRDGFFEASVKITPHKGPREEWVDLEVRLKLGPYYKLGSVKAEGNNAISDDELFKVFDHWGLSWARFTVNSMREDARKAERQLRERGYPAARVTPQFVPERDLDKKNRKVNLQVKVIEKRRVDVRFVGNRAMSDKELREQLTIYESGAYDEVEIAESARALHRAYQGRGYFEARVIPTPRRQGPEGDEVVFVIDEGPELRVRRVELVSPTGAPLTFSEEDLRARAALETKVYPALGVILGGGGYVTNLQLQQDEERLVELYRFEGFPQVKVRGLVARDPSGFESAGALGALVAADQGQERDLFVRFVVEEGPRELVESVEVAFLGEHQKTEKAVLAKLKLTAGTPFTEARFADDQNRILTLYRGAGRPYVKIGYAKTAWNPAHDRIAIRYEIEEGPPVTFGEILIRGNFKTTRRVILLDLPFKSGDPFDLNKLEEGQRNLQTHGIFNAARIVPVRLSEGVNPVPILVVVQERFLERYGSVDFFAGISTDRLPIYVYEGLRWTWNNFFGLGSQAELRFDFSHPVSWGFSARYTDPRAFGPGWRFDLLGFYRAERTNRFGDIQSYGGSIGLTRFLTESVRLFLRFDVYQASRQVGFHRFEGSRDTPTLQDDTVTVKPVTGMVWDRRIGFDGQPNPLMPVKGWMLAASVGGAYYPGTESGALLLSGQAMALAPVRVRGYEFTFIANFRYDEGIPFGSSALPVVERFFAGGDTATRGYEPDLLKIEVTRSEVAPLPGDPGLRIVPQGGNIRLLSTLEIQFPISKTFFSLPWPWVGAVFYDVGAVFDAPNQVQVSDFRHSVGFTLIRLLTTFGPLSLEYAYPITQSVADEKWKYNPWYSHFPGRIHFNWGIPLSRL